MRHAWISITGLGACSLLGALLLSDVSWAKPKKDTYLLCKCTCRAEDELGKLHYGSSNGVWYTTSLDACEVFPTCKVGRLDGIATDCLGEQKAAITPGNLPGFLPQLETVPGAIQVPKTGTIQRRGIEGESAEPEPSAPTSPEEPSGGK